MSQNILLTNARCADWLQSQFKNDWCGTHQFLYFDDLFTDENEARVFWRSNPTDEQWVEWGDDQSTRVSRYWNVLHAKSSDGLVGLAECRWAHLRLRAKRKKLREAMEYAKEHEERLGLHSVNRKRNASARSRKEQLEMIL